MAELARLPAWQMAAGVRDRSISATEALDAHLRQIKRWNPKLNAFVSIDEESARLQAKKADEAVRSGSRVLATAKNLDVLGSGYQFEYDDVPWSDAAGTPGDLYPEAEESRDGGRMGEGGGGGGERE